MATNLPFDTRTLWRFMSGRGMHEKAIGELKTGLAFDTIPTDDYQANSAWQQIVLLAHNLLTNFQIESGLVARNRTLRNTGRWPLKSARTLRFEPSCACNATNRSKNSSKKSPRHYEKRPDL